MAVGKILQKYIDCDGNRYCPYCGRELKCHERYEHYNEWNEYYCDCLDAKKERKIMSQIHELEKQLPAEKYQIKLQVVKKKH